MISKIKKKVNKFESLLIATKKMQEDELALLQLLKLFDAKVFLPLTGWSISPREVLHICNDIAINKRKNIIEFGSGFSTLCIAQLLKINKIEAKFFSVENDQKWANNLMNILESLDLKNYAEIIYSPISDNITPNFLHKNQKKWYEESIIIEKTKDIQSFDLVIVDGPYGKTTPFARYSAIPFLKDRIAENFAVFLDDSNREEEKEISLEWKKVLDCRLLDKQRYIYFSSNSTFDVTPYGL